MNTVYSPRTLGKTDLVVSPLGLGTVEIGLPYGIGVTDLPSDAAAERILKTAVELGITYIDTARGYGVAEERIGKSGIGKLPGVVIGTKCGQFLKQEPGLRGSDLAKRIRDEIDASRKNLQQDRLQLVQLHIELADYTNFQELIETMQALQAEEKVQHVGIATRGEAAPLAAMQTGFFATIQTAYSILDQRMDPRRQGYGGQAPSVFQEALKNGVGIINRSVLLKGALTNSAQQLPGVLAPLKANSQQAATIATELGIDLPALALRFVLSNPAITTALIGTITPAHLTTALAAVAAGPLSPDILQRLEGLAISDPAQVDPAHWPAM